MNYRCDTEIMRALLRSREYWLEKAETVYGDVWLSGKELEKRYPCFTKNWLRSYGQYLKWTRAVLYSDDDNYQCSKKGYSLNYVKKLIKQGHIDCHDRTFYFNEDCTELKRRYLW